MYRQLFMIFILVMIALSSGAQVAMVSDADLEAKPCTDYADYPQWFLDHLEWSRAVETTGAPIRLAVSGTHVFVAEQGLGLEVVDVSDPLLPQIVWTSDPRITAVDVEIVGVRAYVSGGQRGLYVFDITDPANPNMIVNVDTPGYTHAVAVSDKHVYVADAWVGMQVIDLADPAGPRIVGNVATEFTATDIALSGNHVYIADHQSGLLVVNVRKPRRPKIVGGVDTPGSAVGVTLSGNLAYVADRVAGLQVIDISRPKRPRIVGSLDTPGDSYQVAVSGRYAYLADEGEGVQVIDIADPAQPRIVDTVYLFGLASDVVISDDRAWVAVGIAGLKSVLLQCSSDEAWRIDVRPSSAHNRINCGHSHGIVPVAVLSADGNDALDVDPATVRFGPGEARDAFLGESRERRREIDVDDDGDLDLLFWFRLDEAAIPCGATEVMLTGETLDGSAFEAIDAVSTRPSGDGSGALAGGTGCHPNPFNPSTTIWFALEEPGRVSLAVYDIAGRRVAQLRDGVEESAGFHEVVWTGRDDLGRRAPSGIYFYRLQVGDFIETKRMTLLK